ncbi:hypothetical protein QM480_21120 [Flectobacillus sp. DC10W]|uniref:Uncharacterized protein n=1 Tax=Flectobacillus longus TaxID=2984207 RepID=A0ABT6YTD4_9BACT|nr:hypothetical protein [Flectobacillus longus]MDI9866853.1 hypothetical protein [Flectobacillus longus]
MDTLTDFKWEKMYTFSNISRHKMNESLGFEWEYSLDMGMFQEYDIMVIFVKGKEVVSTSYFNDDDREGFIKKKFTMSHKLPFCLKSEAIFKIEKEYGSNGYGFIIYQPQDSDSLTKLYPSRKKNIYLLSIENFIADIVSLRILLAPR